MKIKIDLLIKARIREIADAPTVLFINKEDLNKLKLELGVTIHEDLFGYRTLEIIELDIENTLVY